jgi:hypothetical protein
MTIRMTELIEINFYLLTYWLNSLADNYRESIGMRGRRHKNQDKKN